VILWALLHSNNWKRNLISSQKNPESLSEGKDASLLTKSDGILLYEYRPKTRTL